MNDLERLQTALVNADQAGDTEAATVLAQEVRKMLGATLPKETTPTIPQEDPGKFGSVVIGAGRMTDQILRGVEDLTRTATGGMARLVGANSYADWQAQERAKLAAKNKADTAEYAKLQQMRPVTTTIGEMVPLALFPAAGSTYGAAAAAGALPGLITYGTPAERLGRGALGAAGGMTGKYLGGKIANMLVGKPAQEAVSPVRDATIREMQTEGMVLPPSQVNPSLTNQILEGASGKIKTAQRAASINAPIVTDIAKREIGIPAGEQLTKGAIQAARSPANDAYAAVAKFGTLNIDEQFAQDVGKVVGPYAELAGQFPNSQENKAISGLIKDVMPESKQLQSSAVVSLIRRLRDHGFKNVRSINPPETRDLGGVQLGVQKALEDLLDRQLKAAGKGELLGQYRAARTLLAKSYTVEHALDEATGNVVASVVGKELAHGRPLTGGLETIGKAAQAFPRAVQNINTSVPAISPLDVATGTIAGASEPAFAGIPFLRPLIREGILSRPYQHAFVNPPSQGTFGLLGGHISEQEAILARQLLNRYGGLLGTSALVAGSQ